MKKIWVAKLGGIHRRINLFFRGIAIFRDVWKDFRTLPRRLVLITTWVFLLFLFNLTGSEIDWRKDSLTSSLTPVSLTRVKPISLLFEVVALYNWLKSFLVMPQSRYYKNAFSCEVKFLTRRISHFKSSNLGGPSSWRMQKLFRWSSNRLCAVRLQLFTGQIGFRK